MQTGIFDYWSVPVLTCPTLLYMFMDSWLKPLPGMQSLLYHVGSWRIGMTHFMMC